MMERSTRAGTTDATSSFNRDEIIRAAKLLVTPGGITELRVLHATLKGDRRYEATYSGYFNSASKLADAVATIQSARGVYIIPNEVAPALLARASNKLRYIGKSDPLTSDDGIVARRWLLIDLDASRPAGISSTGGEHEAARVRAEAVRAALTEAGWPVPVLGDSGNGYHLLYRIEIPAKDDGLVQRVLEALSARFSDAVVKIDTSVFNPARIWKLYGTLACKGDSTNDRPHRLARLVDVPENVEVVGISKLQELAATAPEPEPKPTPKKKERAAKQKKAQEFDVAAWLAEHIPDAGEPKPWKDAGRIWNLPSCPFSTDHTDGAFVAQLPGGAASAGCHHESCTWDWHDLRAKFDPSAAGTADDEGDDGASYAELAVRLVYERYRIGQTTKREPFAVRKEGPNIALMLGGNGGAFRDELTLAFRRAFGVVLSASAIADALSVLRGDAMEKPPEETHLRVARLDDQIIFDLGNPDGKVVVIEKGDWAIRAFSPVLFRRTALTGAMPEPAKGGNLDALRDLLNVTPETWPLLLGWILAAYVSDIPHPILLAGGIQGSGKTTAMRFSVWCIDKSSATVRSQPRDPQSWAVTQAGSWASVIDNVSTIPEWWSDALCKVVTGDGWVSRTLYTNQEVSVLEFRRVVGLTSIDAGALRGDLGERLLMVDFSRIPPEKRRTEKELNLAFAAAHPHTLGALFDLLARVMMRLASIKLKRLPRMADFARLLAALDAEQGTNSLELYEGQSRRIASEVVEADEVGVAIVAFMEGRSEWTGTCKQLLSELAEPTNAEKWPKSGQGLGPRLKRLIPALELQEIKVIMPRESDKKRRYVLVKDAPKNAQNAQTPEIGADGAATASDERAFSSDPPENAQERPRDRPTQSGPESSTEAGPSGVLGDLPPTTSGDGEVFL